MKSKEELNTLKTEYENLNKKLSKLSEEEMKEVTGGVDIVPEAIAKLRDEFIDTAIK